MRTNATAGKNRPAAIEPCINVRMPWRVDEVRALPGYRLYVRFLDGLEGYVSMSPLLFSDKAGVFAVLQDSKLFFRVSIEYGAVTWPGGLDLAPDAMYEQIKAQGEWQLQP